MILSGRGITSSVQSPYPENVLLAAGGAVVTFILGPLNDLVWRIVRHRRGRAERPRICPSHPFLRRVVLVCLIHVCFT